MRRVCKLARVVPLDFAMLRVTPGPGGSALTHFASWVGRRRGVDPKPLDRKNSLGALRHFLGIIGRSCLASQEVSSSERRKCIPIPKARVQA